MSAIFETWNRGDNISELVDILRNFSFAATIIIIIMYYVFRSSLTHS